MKAKELLKKINPIINENYDDEFNSFKMNFNDVLTGIKSPEKWASEINTYTGDSKSNVISMLKDALKKFQGTDSESDIQKVISLIKK